MELVKRVRTPVSVNRLIVGEMADATLGPTRSSNTVRMIHLH